MVKKGVTPVTAWWYHRDTDRWKASCRGDVFVPDEVHFIKHRPTPKLIIFGTHNLQTLNTIQSSIKYC